MALGLVGAAAGAAFAGSPSRTHGLNVRTQRALLDVYSLDSRLHAARTRLASLQTVAKGLRRQRTALGQEIEGARSSLKIAERELAIRLRALYEQGTVDPVAVMLGATSLQTAVERLDDLSRTADENRRLVAAALAAHVRLLRSRARLATAARRLARSLLAAHGAERHLETAASARLAYVSSLRSQLRAAQVQSVVRTAHAAQAKSQRLQRAIPAPPPSHGARKLVVKATCYDLPGHTATGMPVGHGVVAVDPSVIPLGTKLYIPGYGNGVAADIGGGIRGAIIDLWYATYAQCAAWGVRTVTITIY